jgi:hypothetical protein
VIRKEALPSPDVDRSNRSGSPKPDRFDASSAKAVPNEKTLIVERLEGSAGRAEGGRKVLLTMFARQIFPSRRAIERFR